MWLYLVLLQLSVPGVAMLREDTAMSLGSVSAGKDGEERNVTSVSHQVHVVSENRPVDQLHATKLIDHFYLSVPTRLETCSTNTSRD